MPKVPKNNKRGLRNRIPKDKAQKDSQPEQGFGGFLRKFMRQFKRYLTTGMLVWIPLIVTLWLAWWVVSNLGFGLEALIAWGVITLNELGSKYSALSFLAYLQYRPGLGFLLTLLLFLTTGFLAQYFLARKLIETGERIIARLPFISRIYTSVQQIRDTFMNREGAVFQEVVIFEYPRKGVYAIGFVTSTQPGIVQEVLEEDLISIFMPSTPNPTTGFLLYVPENELTPLDISIEDAMKVIISGGAFPAVGKKAQLSDSELAQEPQPDKLS